MRGAARRTRQVSLYRRQRVLVDVPSDESTSDEPDDADAPEKIEVHVHVHRDAASGSRRKGPAPRPVLTGVLFDWQGHYDRIFKNPPKAVLKRWSRLARCKSCEAVFPSRAQQCPRCAAPRPSRFLPKVSALLGLGAIIAVFMLCSHVLGGSVPEQKPPAPVGQWSSDDYVIIEMAPTPSPFAATSGGTGSGTATR